MDLKWVAARCCWGSSMIVVVVFLVGVFGCFSKQKHRRSRTKSKVIVSTDQERLKVILYKRTNAIMQFNMKIVKYIIISNMIICNFRISYTI